MDVDGAGPSEPKKSKLPTYVAGKELDDAEMAGEALDILWPFRGAGAWSNWKAIETLWSVPITRSSRSFPTDSPFSSYPGKVP